MIIISASFAVQPAQREQIIALCSEHSARSRDEPGCISHNIYADCDDPARPFFHEEWQDEAAVAAHFAVPASGDFVNRLTALLGERPEIRMYRAHAVLMAELG
ncbi:putative quinol monooxygenase [Parasphingorhabdus sp.]|uniref:putative quinol monooxygenase n=1 Tax=Parasphingorhabdus sp. TaxID=2709688 RepID=UPI003002F3C3